MGTRKEYATRILNDFSHQITPQLYWKLYILAYCLNDDPKVIKSKMKKELETISFDRYSKLDIDGLKVEYAKYNKSNNDKIDTIKGKKKKEKDKKNRQIYNLPKLLHVSQLTKIFNESFPSPYAAGFIESNWTAELKNAVKKYYLGSSVSTLHISKALTDIDLLKYYLSRPYYDFFYVHLQITEYEPRRNGFNYKTERRYDHTYVSMLLHYAKDDSSDKYHIKIISSNQGAYAHDNDYSYSLDDILSLLFENTHTNKRPLIFIYNPHKVIQENFILNTTQPHNYSLYCFEDFSTILPIIVQNHEKLYTFLRIIKKCNENASKIDFKFYENIKNSNHIFKEKIHDAFIEQIRSEKNN